MSGGWSVQPLGWRRQTFREQIHELLERYQRRTVRLAGLLAVPVSRSTALRRLPLPQQVIPRVIGVDDFALRRHRILLL